LPRLLAWPKAALVAVLLQPASASRVAERGKVKLNGDESVLTTYAGLLDQFDPNFNIVTPDSHHPNAGVPNHLVFRHHDSGERRRI
jgi:hypothetical protein